MLISNSLLRIKPSATLEITAKAALLKSQGKDVISLSIGEPDFFTPEVAQNAGIDAIKNCDDKYPPTSGTAQLKDKIIEKFKTDNGLDYKRSQIIVSNGAKQVLFNAFFALLNPGDEVLLPTPYWVSYSDMVKVPGGVPIAVKSDKNFKIDIADLENKISEKTKVLVINSPNNPSGVCYDKSDLEVLAKVLLKHPKIQIISDDIYEHILYDEQKFCNILQVEPKLKEQTIIVNGVSKCYAMTGWRIGYAAIPNPEIFKYINILQMQTTGGACSIAQAAAVGALSTDHSLFKQRSLVFKSRRDSALQILSSAPGLECNKPSGAFYLFPCCKGLIGKQTKNGKKISNDVEFTTYLLEEYLLSVVPGSEFGMPGYFRISYALSTEKLEIACKRIVKACEELFAL